VISDEDFTKTLAALKLTDQEAGDLLHVSQVTVSQWRAGENLPHQSVRAQILKTLRIRELFRAEDAKAAPVVNEAFRTWFKNEERRD